MMGSQKIVVVGAGALGSALSRGMANDPGRRSGLYLLDVLPQRAQSVAEKIGARAISADQLEESVDALLLAVKPAAVETALRDVAPAIGPETVVISCAAGTTIQAVIDVLGGTPKVVRAMPNVAARVNSSCTVLVPGPGISEDNFALAAELFLAVGTVHRVHDESVLHAVTALAASGPAFAALLLESFIDAGVRAGLSRQLAEQLTLEMAQGTVALLSSPMMPAELRAAVTSPGGTTAAGLAVLERAAIRGAVSDAIWAAADRSRELGEQE